MKKHPKLIDLQGQIFGSWTVVEQSGNNARGAALWLCKCACGKTGHPSGVDLRAGKSRSCGCVGDEIFHASTRKHGASTSPLHNVWKSMRQRCLNPRDAAYKNYGGRGIAISEAWSNFQTFSDWALLSGYDQALSIERIDVDQGYSPDNCTWATKKVQAVNRRFVRKNSDGLALCTIAEANGISARLFNGRMTDDWTPEQATTIPKGGRR
jgi:hypothetical protein